MQARKPSVRVFLADPPGSALYHRVTHGVLYTAEQQERTAKRHRYDTVMEGVGCDRVTRNFDAARVDGAFKVRDGNGRTRCPTCAPSDAHAAGGAHVGR